MSAHALIAAIPAAQKFEAAMQGTHGIRDFKVSMRTDWGDFIATWAYHDGVEDAVSLPLADLADLDTLAKEVSHVIGGEIYCRENPIEGEH